MDFYIGQICLFPWNWAPEGWAKCDGQLLSIRENQALFALIGTEFGGMVEPILRCLSCRRC